MYGKSKLTTLQKFLHAYEVEILMEIEWGGVTSERDQGKSVQLALPRTQGPTNSHSKQ